MDELTWLAGWYESQCDGSWEHQQGIEITTLDNPGWMVVIDLAHTSLEQRPFTAIKDESADGAVWLHCWVDDGRFIAACDPGRLRDTLKTFMAWANADPA